MGWLGAGIGAGIGMAVGGPIGAGIGAFIGSAFGNNKDEQIGVCPHCGKQFPISPNGMSSCPYCHAPFATNTQTNQITFLVTFCAMLAKMAKADGLVSKEEINTVSGVFDKIGLDHDDKKIAIELFNAAKNDSTSIYEYAKQYSSIADIEMCEMMYAVLWDIAKADGKIHPHENDILKNITSYLGIPASRYNEYQNIKQSNSTPNIAECYEILDCSENDSDQVIKQKYRKLAIEYHPDKIQAKGLPDGFLKFANEQLQKINTAYDTIKKSRNL